MDLFGGQATDEQITLPFWKFVAVVKRHTGNIQYRIPGNVWIYHLQTTRCGRRWYPTAGAHDSKERPTIIAAGLENVHLVAVFSYPHLSGHRMDGHTVYCPMAISKYFRTMSRLAGERVARRRTTIIAES